MLIRSVTVQKEFLIIVGILIWIIYFILKLITTKKKDWKFYKRIISRFIFIIYICLLVGVTLFPITFPRYETKLDPVFNLNLLSIFEYGINKYALVNIVGNVMLLLPFPILIWLMGYDKYNTYKSIIVTSFLISLSIETLQVIETISGLIPIARAFDILDLILNTLGSVLGLFILKKYRTFNNGTIEQK